mmetsp:Transcript_19160/g.42843  ORF Transcript_19160/g.42843 Transcript_19160/m.42843 type:complete len:81 (-) Transcript_19160:2352-2594(-)
MTRQSSAMLIDEPPHRHPDAITHTSVRARRDQIHEIDIFASADRSHWPTDRLPLALPGFPQESLLGRIAGSPPGVMVPTI